MKSKIILAIVGIFFATQVFSSNHPNNWSNETAYQLAVASDCAYEAGNGKPAVERCFQKAVDEAKKNNSDVLNIFDGLSGNVVDVIRTEGKYGSDKINAAILIKIHDGMILAFRGTDLAIADWLNDFFLTSVENLPEGTLYDRGRHYGFNLSLEALTEEIHKSSLWQSTKDQKNKTLYITGHSKGGALATGATVDFAEEFGGRIVTYTFEAARFFTAKILDTQENSEEWDIKALLDNIWRFEYQHDFVPHVPLGQVTHDLLVQIRNFDSENFDKFSRNLGFKSSNWLQPNNNINFLSAGKLMYVDQERKLIESPDQHSGHYKERVGALLLKTAQHSNDPSYQIKQHSNCYIEFLKAKVINSLPVNEENCL